MANEPRKDETRAADAKALAKLVDMLERMAPEARTAAITYLNLTFGVKAFSAKETP